MSSQLRRSPTFYAAILAAAATGLLWLGITALSWPALTVAVVLGGWSMALFIDDAGEE